MVTATTNRKYFNELLKNPLFFMQLMDKSYNEIRYGTNNSVEIVEIENIFLESTKKEISAFIHDKNIVDNMKVDYLLLIVEGEVDNSHDEKARTLSDTVTFSFHIANPQYDWVVVINSLIIRSQNTEDKFPFIYMIWFLNHSDWNVQQLIYAINQYDIGIQTYIFNWLKKGCRCLSVQKQQQIKEVMRYYNYEYQIYSPLAINEALKYVTPSIIKSKMNLNLFDLVDHIFGDDGEYYDKDGNLVNYEINTNSSNDLICLYKWFTTNEPFKDYQLLKSIYPLVSQERQLQIIKRYFHDIRLGNAKFDIEIVEQFRNSDFDIFMRYRYCINAPDSKMNIGNKLLCDCILTLNKTQGKSFQSFNGILDFAINHCDMTNPNIDLGLILFLPCCNGGAVYNDRFKGFIDYSITISLDDKKFTNDSLEKTIKCILDTKGERKCYFTYMCDDSKTPLSVDSKCFKFKHKINSITSVMCENKWTVSTSDYAWLNLFIKKTISENSSDEKFDISMDDVSVENMKASICKIAGRYEQAKLGTYIILSKDINTFECKLLFEYSVPKTMRIYPQTQAYIGFQFDVFGIKKSLPHNNNEEKMSKDFYVKESSEVTKRVITSLKTVLNNNNYNGEYFEIPYNKSLLGKLLRLYYNKGSISHDAKDDEFFFLKRKSTKGFPTFCAPKLANAYNQATDLPFFWCRGSECFHNVLDRQMLQETDSWNQYTLFHLVEIIGYPKLHKKEGGYEPDSIISIFIVVANRVMKKLGRLKCRACGHLMYPVKSEEFNRYNNYYCINPSCSEYETAVYLSYCYKCKKGFIDSRDGKQCPNGWYICPTCLSCCDDQQYERLAQRYVISHRPIPGRIQAKLGMGHNDKGIYYCPYCGSEMDFIDKKTVYCRSCHKTFDVVDNCKNS